MALTRPAQPASGESRVKRLVRGRNRHPRRGPSRYLGAMAAGDGETGLRFGISIVPATEGLDRIRVLVQAADEAALDLVGIQDHPYQHHFLATWSLMGTLPAET